MRRRGLLTETGGQAADEEALADEVEHEHRHCGDQRAGHDQRLVGEKPALEEREAGGERSGAASGEKKAIRSSFQTHTALTTTIVTMAGAESGRMRLQSVRSRRAPSMCGVLERPGDRGKEIDEENGERYEQPGVDDDHRQTRVD